MAGALSHGGVEHPAPQGFHWPEGKRLAVLFSVAYEGWSEGKWPGIGPMGNPLQSGHPDLNAFSWGEYGARRGIWRILRRLERQKLSASVMVCGVLAERYPESVRAIADAGHEIVAHSYAMDVIPVTLNEADERANIERTTALIEKACGVRAKGWISPRGTPSPRTSRLLAEAGYEWHGDQLDDDLPYLIEFGSRSIVALPFSMEVNDLPSHVRYGNAPRRMLEVFEDSLAAMRELDEEALKIDATIHAHVFGRPPGLWVYERIIEAARRAPDVWLGTHAEAAAHFRRVLG